ncbi:MAG: hemerythrin domain-containing protein [Candidatus Omnitrophica bacterium]|nr:hemerythrin domain-containing protein [Candidatus Omnitrophota bacterium]
MVRLSLTILSVFCRRTTPSKVEGLSTVVSDPPRFVAEVEPLAKNGECVAVNPNGKVANEFLAQLEEAHKSAFGEIKKFEEAASNLQFEGKTSIGRNLKQVRSSLDFFRSSLLQHIDLEEKILFPFLKLHIPKLESVIHLVVTEHEDARRNFDDLELFLDSLSNQMSEMDRAKMMKKVQDTATYLVYLLKNHLRVEDKGIYEVAGHELKVEEKKELEGAMGKFLSKP